MVFLKDEMDEVLSRTDLHPEEKLKLFQTAQQRFSSLMPSLQLAKTPALSTIPETEEPAEEGRAAPGPSAPPKPVVSPFAAVKVPKTFQGNAAEMIEFLDEHPGMFTISHKGEMIIDGQPIPNSNYKDIFYHLFVQKKSDTKGVNQFLDALRELNVPKKIITNRFAKRYIEEGEGPSSSIVKQEGSGMKIAPRKRTPRNRPPGKRPRILYLYHK